MVLKIGVVMRICLSNFTIMCLIFQKQYSNIYNKNKNNHQISHMLVFSRVSYYLELFYAARHAVPPYKSIRNPFLTLVDPFFCDDFCTKDEILISDGQSRVASSTTIKARNKCVCNPLEITTSSPFVTLPRCQRWYWTILPVLFFNTCVIQGVRYIIIGYVISHVFCVG